MLLEEPASLEPDIETIAAKALLDTLLFQKAGIAMPLVTEMAGHLDLEQHYDFDTSFAPDTTLLSDCVNTNLPCSSSTQGGTTILRSSGMDIYGTILRSSTFAASGSLDSLLDSATRSITLERHSLATWKPISSVRSSHARYSTSQGAYTTSSYETSSSDSTIFNYRIGTGKLGESSFRSARLRKAPNAPTGWLQASRVSILAKDTNQWSWTALGKALIPGDRSSKDVLVDWKSATGERMHGQVNLAEGKASLRSLEARHLRNFDSLWLEEGNRLVMASASDTVRVGWHQTNLSQPSFDSITLHLSKYGTRWSDVRLRLRWESPILEPYSGVATSVHFEALETNGQYRVMEGKVTLSPSLQEQNRWQEFHSSIRSSH